MARCKGTGSLIKRGRYWQCKIVVDGVPHYKATGTASKVEARKILDDFVKPFLAGSDAERLAAVESRLRMKETDAAEREDDYSNTRLQFLLDRYYQTANAKPVAKSTRRNYDIFADKFVKWAAENMPAVRKVKDIDKAIAEKYLEHIKPDFSAGFFNGSLALFRKVWKEFGRLSKHRCFSENPWDGFRYKGADLPVKRPLTTDEIDRLFKAARDADTRLLFSLGLYTGLRLGDCSCLKWSDIDFERRAIRLVPMKTRKSGRSVTIPIHPSLFAELEARRRLALAGPGADGYVSAKLAANYKSGNFESVRAAFAEADIKTMEGGRTVVSFHSFRHTFCSMAAASGIPLDIVRQIVGHTTTKMTEHYSHADAGALARAVNAIPAIGQAVSRKVLVEIGSAVLNELSGLGLTVEEALSEFLAARRNTITVAPAA